MTTRTSARPDRSSETPEAPSATDLAGQARSLSQDSQPADLIAWGALLGARKDDQALAAELFEELGPRETARLLRLAGFAADRSQTFPLEMVETLEAMKATIAGGSQRFADARGFADELARWLLPTELTDDEHGQLLGNGGLPLAGPSALAQLLLGTRLHPEFLAGLRERVDHFERSGKVDPLDYYRRTTPARFDDYRPRDISSLLDDQQRRAQDS
ncbi:hypothetical protein [Nocardioides sp. MH1]|uniref:hypothetical protein n=1 Tax=Nocardioides sp. MH1 TaxID=3242490 RepID=UPI003521AAD8